MQRLQVFAIQLLAVLGLTLQPAAAETIRIGGTGSVIGLLQALADPFSRLSPTDSLEIIPGLGSSGALSAAAAGALSVAVAGRALTEKELGQGLVDAPFVETPFVFVAATRTKLELSRADIVQIYSGDWQTFPDGKPLRLILRPRSDAASIYMAAAIEGVAAALEKARKRPDLPVAATDQDNMEMALRMAGAFTAMTLTQLSTELNGLQRIRYEGVDASIDAMRQGVYPLKLATRLVTKAKPSEGVRRFLAFLSTYEALSIIELNGGSLMQQQSASR